MNKITLLIDWENFKYKIKDILKNNQKNTDLKTVNYNSLINSVFPNITFNEKVCYMARIKKHQKYPEKSTQLIESQRSLKTYLEKSGFSVVMCGVVRSFETSEGVVFKEKGVDVYLAVEMVKRAFSGQYSNVMLISSDSDMNPAINEVKNKKVKVTYVGFQREPNKGLIYNSNETILIRDSEVLASLTY